MKVAAYNQEGKEVSQTLLPKEIFDVKMSPDLVHQVVVAQMGNRRRIIANTKTKDEVRGGGRKPWKQKHTGRARHGSIRSPLWRKGGIIFGPRKEEVYKQKINKKMGRKSLFMVLSSKVKDNEILVLEDLNLEKKGKTKTLVALIENLKSKIENFKKGKILIVLPQKDEALTRAARNISDIGLVEARNLNTLDLLNYKYLLMPKETIKVIKETFGEKSKTQNEEVEIKS